MELKKLKIRTAWVERDTLFAQIEVAKVTMICRGFPESFTAEDRERVIRNNLKAAGLDPSWQQIHTVQFQGEDDKTQLSSHTLLRFFSTQDKRRFTDYFSTPGYPTMLPVQDWREVNAQDPQDPDRKEWQEVEIKEKVKCTPAVTQFERRLTAPMHELMNAFTAAFPKRFKGHTLKPYWKTLVITDPATESWIGQLKYVRKQHSPSMTTATPTDWECHILLPEEVFDKVMEEWSRGWHSQLSKQYELTESEDELAKKASEQTAQDYSTASRVTTMLRKAKPAWNAQQDEGVPAFMARYKWEYPWEITFIKVHRDDPLRQAWKALPTVEELMQHMATDDVANMEADADPSKQMTQWASTAEKRAASQEATGQAAKRHESSQPAQSSQSSQPSQEPGGYGKMSQPSQSEGKAGPGKGKGHTAGGAGGPYPAQS